MKKARNKTFGVLGSGPPKHMIEQEFRDLEKRLEIMRRIRKGERITFNTNIK